MPPLTLRHIYISPGHAYFGRYGLGAAEHPTVEVPEVRCLAGRGLEGDRFLDYKAGYKGQITFFAWESYADLSERLSVRDRSPAVFRRNVITEGVDLNAWIGEEFTIQGVRFQGTEEARPCAWMDEAFAPGAEVALRGRGGLRARILDDGMLRAGPG